jgi:hypothetical protein
VVVKDFNCNAMVFFDKLYYLDFHGSVDGFTGSGGIYAPIHCKGNIGNANVELLPVTLELSHNIDTGIFLGTNCGCFALSFAIALGFKQVYLMGMDCKFSKDGKDTHYHNHYDTQYKRESSMAKMLTSFRKVGLSVKHNHPDVTIYNCQPEENGHYIDPMETFGFTNINYEEALHGDTRTDRK